MREIKFRAWDKENNFMFYSENNYPVSKYDLGFDFMGRNEFRLMMLIDVKDSLFKKVDADIMQYTSLKDKNGKEIYEGDIVNYFRNELAEVKFINGCFAIKSNSCIDYFNQIIAEIEVVGNIYENKDLLK